jgi:hypothetical protein
MSSVIYLTRKNRPRPERCEFDGSCMEVAELRRRVARDLSLDDPQEVELRCAAGRLLTDDCPAVQRQASVEVRRKPVASKNQRSLGAQTQAWERARRAAAPGGGWGRDTTAPAVPLSQQQQQQQQQQQAPHGRAFGIGTFAGTEGAAAYGDPGAAPAVARPTPAAPRLTAPPQPPVQFSAEKIPHGGGGSPDCDRPASTRPPKEFACSLCSDWISDAVILPCCYVSVCRACVEHAAAAGTCCRSCHAPLPDPAASSAGPNSSPPQQQQQLCSNRNLNAIIVQMRLAQLTANNAQRSAPTDDAPSSPSPSHNHNRSNQPKAHAHGGDTEQVEDEDENDLYAVLGVAPHSTASEIAKAFRQKALTCHPDKHQHYQHPANASSSSASVLPAAAASGVSDHSDGSAAAASEASAALIKAKTAQFVRLSAAYELLSDTTARRRYDHTRMMKMKNANNSKRSHSSSHSSSHSYYSSAFGSASSGKRQRR